MWLSRAHSWAMGVTAAPDKETLSAEGRTQTVPLWGWVQLSHRVTLQQGVWLG